MDKEHLLPGYEIYHNDIALNFQLNRLRTNAGCSIKELKSLGAQIEKYSDVTPLALEFYQSAMSENRTIHGLFYLRLAEFFCFTGEEEKNRLYNQFRALFYKIYSNKVITHEVPYENGALSVIECFESLSGW